MTRLYSSLYAQLPLPSSDGIRFGSRLTLPLALDLPDRFTQLHVTPLLIRDHGDIRL